jgi:hypothetical protein
MTSLKTKNVHLSNGAGRLISLGIFQCTNSPDSIKLFGNPAIHPAAQINWVSALTKLFSCQKAQEIISNLLKGMDPWLCVTGLRQFCHYRS